MIGSESRIDYPQFRLIGTRDYLAPDEQCVEIEPTGLGVAVNENKSDLLLESELRRFAEPIERNGGEILKFMGDGMLAIFAADADAAAACDRALDAAQAAARAVDTFNDIRSHNKEPLLAYGLALHLGEVGFGNIGSRRRLDFTVIGPAVNHASRLQELTKTLGQPMLVSEEFAAATTRPLQPLGRHALRDVAPETALFTAEWARLRGTK